MKIVKSNKKVLSSKDLKEKSPIIKSADLKKNLTKSQNLVKIHELNSPQ